jgi:hypothetical protein
MVGVFNYSKNKNDYIITFMISDSRDSHSDGFQVIIIEIDFKSLYMNKENNLNIFSYRYVT